MDANGFCYTGPGQKYCGGVGSAILSADGVEAVPADPRCLTEVLDPVHPACKVNTSASDSKLPKPSYVGLLPGLRLKFYYIGTKMDRMPNLRTRVPNFVATAEELNFDTRAAFKAIDPNLPEDFFAVVVDAVIAVVEAGEHIFYMNSKDGSQLWVDGRMIIDTGSLHSADEVKEASVPLDRGYHSIKINYFVSHSADEGEASLNAQWKGPTTEGRQEYLTGFYFENSESSAKSQSPLPSITDLGLAQGFLMSVYTTKLPDHMDKVPDLDMMRPDFISSTSTIDFRGWDAFKSVIPEIPYENFAAEWVGVIPVDEEGEYKFYLSSSDGAHLWVDEKIIIDNDGLKNGKSEITGGPVQLSRGYHNLKIDYFVSPSAEARCFIKIAWSGPGVLGRQFLAGYHFVNPTTHKPPQEERPKEPSKNEKEKEDKLEVALRAVEEAKKRDDEERAKLTQANAAAEVAKETEQEEREKLSAAHAEVETLMNKEKEAIANKEGAESLTTIHEVVEAAMKAEEVASARLHAAEAAEEASANEARREVIMEGMWHFEAVKAAAEAESERLASQSALTEELKKQEEEVT
jgi:hypothetical protein